MREVKFRAFNKTKGMFYVDSMNWAMGKLIDFGTFSDTVLMQYVGQKDKFDKEIYEGDIVKYKNQYICKVIYFEKSCSFVLEYKDDSGNIEYYRIIKGNEFEIIGNIYEHSHLL